MNLAMWWIANLVAVASCPWACFVTVPGLLLAFFDNDDE